MDFFRVSCKKFPLLREHDLAGRVGYLDGGDGAGAGGVQDVFGAVGIDSAEDDGFSGIIERECLRSDTSTRGGADTDGWVYFDSPTIIGLGLIRIGGVFDVCHKIFLTGLINGVGGLLSGVFRVRGART